MAELGLTRRGHRFITMVEREMPDTLVWSYTGTRFVFGA